MLNLYLFCPACCVEHDIQVPEPGHLYWNQDLSKPYINFTIKTESYGKVCKFSIIVNISIGNNVVISIGDIDGKILFLNESEHYMKGSYHRVSVYKR